MDVGRRNWNLFANQINQQNFGYSKKMLDEWSKSIVLSLLMISCEGGQF